MAFLDNSGDIILDAVLTDAGRKRLSRGDGTFKVTKYAFGDDEINYESYVPDHVSGSAYYDLEILQTPVLEAFTNNASSLKNKLITLTNNNLLFLPQLVLNEVGDQTKRAVSSSLGAGQFLVGINVETQATLTDITNLKFLKGANATVGVDSPFIRIDQGLKTDKLSAVNSLASELTEQQYMIQMDNRLGGVTDIVSSQTASPSFIDDDQIATYYITKGVGGFVASCLPGQVDGATTDANFVGAGKGEDDGNEVLVGPRGTKLRFGIIAGSNLQSSDYLFDTIGQGTVTDTNAVNYKAIDTTIKVIGITTGYSLDIPVRFLKKTS